MKIHKQPLKLIAVCVLVVLAGCVSTGGSSDAPSSLSGRAQNQFEDAVAAMADQRWADAEILLQSVSEDQPQAGGVWLNLGIAQFQLQRVEDAEQSLRQALAVEPARPEIGNWLARVLREQGRFSDADGVYQQVLSAHPDHADTHRNLGILYELYLGQPAQALSYYQRYQALQGENPDRQVAGWLIDLERRL